MTVAAMTKNGKTTAPARDVAAVKGVLAQNYKIRRQSWEPGTTIVRKRELENRLGTGLDKRKNKHRGNK